MTKVFTTGCPTCYCNLRYGFISAGGGNWYSHTLKLLSPGDRIWVNIPQTGYVGVGIVTSEMQKAKDVTFEINGKACGLAEMDVKGSYLYCPDEPEKAEYIVKVEWIKTVSESQAVKELGFFGNQNSVCHPKSQKWNYTIERLKTLWHIDT